VMAGELESTSDSAGDKLLAELFGQTTQPLSDQEIRARALECAVRLGVPRVPTGLDEFWDRVREFEAYIRDGR